MFEPARTVGTALAAGAIEAAHPPRTLVQHAIQEQAGAHS